MVEAAAARIHHRIEETAETKGRSVPAPHVGGVGGAVWTPRLEAIERLGEHTRVVEQRLEIDAFGRRAKTADDVAQP